MKKLRKLVESKRWALWTAVWTTLAWRQWFLYDKKKKDPKDQK